MLPSAEPAGLLEARIQPSLRRARVWREVENQALAVGRGAGTASWVLVGILIAAYLLAFALSVKVRLPFPAEFTYGEAVVLDGARRVARDELLYPPPDRLPLVVSAYMPLYYWMVGHLMRLFGDGYAVGRALSLSATLGATALLVWSVRRVSGQLWGGLLAGGLFLTQNMTVLLWAPLHRVDMLALGFALAGLSLATAGRTHWAVLPLLAALLTKQSYVVAPIAVALALWPRWRSSLGFAGLLGAGILSATGIAQALSDGWFLWYTTVANANPMRLDYFLAQIYPFLHFNALPLLAAGLMLLLPSQAAEKPWRWYFVVALLTLSGIAKVGASSNYWLELTAATSALIGLVAVRLAALPRPRGAWGHAGLGALLLASLLVVAPGYRAVVVEAGVILPAGGAGSVAAQIALAPALAAVPGDLLTDDPSLAVAAGKPILFEFVIFRLLAEQGLWDQRPILEAIAARRFEIVALRMPLDAPLGDTEWTAGVRDALVGAYAPAGRAADRWLYRPRATDVLAEAIP